MKLFTIGDSVSQGFMSLAAARTDLSYSALIAGSMNLRFGSEYRYPKWEAGGLPVNLERVCRSIEPYGPNIWGPEWLQVIRTINDVVDEAEDYYEREQGAADAPYQDPASAGRDVQYFHNVAVQGFDIADSWLVTPELCKRKIDEDGGGGESFFAPNAAFYRTALKVLNPSLDPQYDQYSQLEWLKKHTTDENEGVENLLLWLGANNALGTVVGLKIRQTPNDLDQRPHLLSHEEREGAGWTLWHPADFEAEYAELLFISITKSIRMDSAHHDH